MHLVECTISPPSPHHHVGGDDDDFGRVDRVPRSLLWELGLGHIDLWRLEEEEAEEKEVKRCRGGTGGKTGIYTAGGGPVCDATPAQTRAQGAARWLKSRRQFRL